MDVNVYKFSNRVLIVDKSNDQLVRAKIICALEDNKLLTSSFDITNNIQTDNYYINLFRHDFGLKELTRILVPKPRKSAKHHLRKLDDARTHILQLLVVASKHHKPLTSGALSTLLSDRKSLLSLSKRCIKSEYIDGPLTIIKEAFSREHLMDVITDIESSYLFNSNTITQGQNLNIERSEFDMSILIHCDVPVFIYSPKKADSPLIIDRLLVNYLRAGLRMDAYNPNSESKRNLDRLCHAIEAFSIIPLKANSKPKLSELNLLMA
ncbi:MAG: hypothetical protein ACI936_001723 [Paraglaciecola sp.]|jgi:hypothetical protein